MQRIKGYHAHVYYDAATMEQARELCEEAARLFPVTMGRMHQKPVGPHPDWSCQLAFGPEVV
ncbi:MAG: DOPA 4,5-dioxygenase family protein, partial [Pseudomonas putida]